MNGLVVYRELSDPSPSLVQWLEGRDQLFVVLDPKNVEHTYIDNDTPRDQDITHEIVGTPDSPFPGCTKGFALFTAEGDYVCGYNSLIKALEAKANARIVTTPVVDGVEAETGWTSIDGDGTEKDA